MFKLTSYTDKIIQWLEKESPVIPAARATNVINDISTAKILDYGKALSTFRNGGTGPFSFKTKR